MKGDFTRLRFDPAEHYSDVLMQQGRVQLDADWNEQRAIDAARRQHDGLSIVGGAAAPAGDMGFAIQPTADGSGLVISPGTLHVGGVACRNEAATPLDAQPSAPGQTLPAAGRTMVYLDCWDRHVTWRQDPALRDPALGGPDTTTRVQTIWQVRTLGVAAGTLGYAINSDTFPPAPSTGTLIPATAAATGGDACSLPVPGGYSSLSNQLYRVEIHVDGTVGGTANGAPGPMFKWSRDNGTVVAGVLGASGQTLTLDDLGADDSLAFAQGQVVELLRPEDELGLVPGTLLLVASVQPDAMSVTIDPGTMLPGWVASRASWTGVLLRRWDMDASAVAGMPVATTQMALENGLSVAFGSGSYRCGNWWTVPARAVPGGSGTGSLLWPLAGGASGVGPAGGYAALPAEGITHRYAPLALVDATPGAAAGALVFTLVEDLRTRFEPLAGRVLPFRAGFGPSGPQLAPGAAVSPEQLAGGLWLSTPTPLQAVSVTPASVQLVVEAPVTLSQVMGAAGVPMGNLLDGVVGTQPVSLDCTTTLTEATAIMLVPGSTALDLLHQLLGSVTGGSVGGLFQVDDESAWPIGADGAVTAGKGPQAPVTTPMVALALQPPQQPVAQLALEMAPGSGWGNVQTGGMAGLVFNATDEQNYWVFYYFCRAVGNGSQWELGFGVAHYAGAGTPASTVEDTTSYYFQPSTITLDILAGPSGLQFGYRMGSGTATPLSLAGPLPTTLDPEAAVGLFSTGDYATAFRDLGWILEGGESVPVLPAGAGNELLARVLVRTSLLRAEADGAPAFVEPAFASAPDFQTWFRIVAPQNTGYGSTYAFFDSLGAFGAELA